MWMGMGPIAIATCGPMSKDKTGWWTYQSCLHGEMTPRNRILILTHVAYTNALRNSEGSPGRREEKHQIGWDFKTLSRSWKIMYASVEEKIELLLYAWTVDWDTSYTEKWKKKKWKKKFCCFLLEWIQIQLFCWIQMYLLAIYRIKDSTCRIKNNKYFSLYFTGWGMWFCNIYLYEWEQTQRKVFFFLFTR